MVGAESGVILEKGKKERKKVRLFLAVSIARHSQNIARVGFLHMKKKKRLRVRMYQNSVATAIQRVKSPAKIRYPRG